MSKEHTAADAFVAKKAEIDAMLQRLQDFRVLRRRASRMNGGVMHAARAALGLSQAEFGAWLAEQMGLPDPIPTSRVSEWENGKRSPRRNVREVCARRPLRWWI